MKLSEKIIKSFEVEISTAQNSLLRTGEDNLARESKISRILAFQRATLIVKEALAETDEEEFEDDKPEERIADKKPVRRNRRPSAWGNS